MSSRVTDADRFSQQFTLEQLREMSQLIEQGKLEEVRVLLGASEVPTRDVQGAVHRALRTGERSRQFLMSMAGYIPTTRGASGARS